MELGAFSISLGVKDLAKSKAFYETLVGLFEGMFEGPMLTFNPGWDQSAGELPSFDDVRDIKAKLKADGLDIQQENGGDTGPASFVVIDPDGYPVLIDQHR